MLRCTGKASRASVTIDSNRNNFRHVQEIEGLFWKIDSKDADEQTGETPEMMVDVSAFGDAIEDLDEDVFQALV